MTTFRLSDFYRENVVKDGVFHTLGIIDSKVKLPFLTFIADKKYIDKLLKNEFISCIIATKEIYESCLKNTSYGCVISDQPRIDFFKLHNYLSTQEIYQRPQYETKIGSNCNISPLACISKNNVTIGNDVVIEEFVSVKENVVIGDHSVIRAGTIIGGCGFEFKKNEKEVFRVEHCGGVNIGSNVEIQYNCCIDKAIYPWDDTEIGNDSKLDNLIYIAHAVKIKERVMMPALVAVGGRAEIQDDAWIGLAAAVRNGITIGSNARANMGAVVTKDVEANQAVSGNFAVEHSKFIDKLRKGE